MITWYQQITIQQYILRKSSIQQRWNFSLHPVRFESALQINSAYNKQFKSNTQLNSYTITNAISISDVLSKVLNATMGPKYNPGRADQFVTARWV